MCVRQDFESCEVATQNFDDPYLSVLYYTKDLLTEVALSAQPRLPETQAQIKRKLCEVQKPESDACCSCSDQEAHVPHVELYHTTILEEFFIFIFGKSPPQINRRTNDGCPNGVCLSSSLSFSSSEYILLTYARTYIHTRRITRPHEGQH
jgi:hypothetical protein